MTILNFIILSLATWRVANLFVHEEGPFHIFSHLREWSGIHYDDNGNKIVPERFFAELLSCIWCFSMWAGAFWVLFWWFLPIIAIFFAVWPALSAAAILFDKFAKE